MLCPLEPNGVGTGDVESLSSYLVRLAARQVLPTAVLAPRLFAGKLPSVSYPGARNLYGGRGVWMNGMGRWARAIVSRLNEATSRDDLTGLTALPWQGVLAPGGLTANVRRWCPHCYRQMRSRHGECWDPLLWFLAPVTCCPVHAHALAMHCPGCGVVQPWLPHDTAVGWCAECGADLAAAQPEAGRGTLLPPRQIWMARVCADLCAALEAMTKHPSRTATPRDFSRVVRHLVDTLDGGNRSAFARRIGVSVHSPSRWIASGTVSIDSLLRLCMQLGARPIHFLLRGGDVPVGPREVQAPPSQRRRSAIDWDQIDARFEAMLRDPETVSLREAARTLGVRVNSLRKRLPGRVRELRRRERRMDTL